MIIRSSGNFITCWSASIHLSKLSHDDVFSYRWNKSFGNLGYGHSDIFNSCGWSKNFSNWRKR